MTEFEPAPGAPIEPGYRFSRTHAFDEEQVRKFAEAAGDDNPLHHDAEFARGTRFGGLIASGTHTTSLLMGLTASHFAKKGNVLGINFRSTCCAPYSRARRSSSSGTCYRLRTDREAAASSRCRGG
ncbi:MaoC family dehydratase [Variovorax paradoxus]|uniref:MaoC family dehydratase n=1 Tax=Variovorax paradoxus TaxID=34073 RepID=UPI0024808899|nr:MaoC family dehydratase [Variovorax paradoxus]WGT61277.1 MaoC family dehydratase [Variovorax paradoxus]